MKKIDIFLIIMWYIVTHWVLQTFGVDDYLFLHIRVAYNYALGYIIVSLIVLYEIRLRKIIPFGLFIGVLLFFVVHLILSVVFGIVPNFCHDNQFMISYYYKKYFWVRYFDKYISPNRPL